MVRVFLERVHVVGTCASCEYVREREKYLTASFLTENAQLLIQNIFLLQLIYISKRKKDLCVTVLN